MTDAMGQGNSGKKKSQSGKEIGPLPWAPAYGYRAKTRYVYFKDYDVYYDNTRGVYIFISGRKWVVTAKLPSVLTGIDLVAAVKIDLDFDGDDPQRDHDSHQKKYPKSKKQH